jgi:hypothetical protein
LNGSAQVVVMIALLTFVTLFKQPTLFHAIHGRYYVADARGHAARCRETVQQYLTANKKVAGLLKDVQSQLLVDIEERKVYNLDDFVKCQANRLVLRSELIRGLHRQILKILHETRKVPPPLPARALGRRTHIHQLAS